MATASQTGANAAGPGAARGGAAPRTRPTAEAHAVGSALSHLGRYSSLAGELGHGVSTVASLIDTWHQFSGMIGGAPGGAPIPTLQKHIPTLQPAGAPPPGTPPTLQPVTPPAQNRPPLFPAKPGMPPAFKSPPKAPKPAPAPLPPIFDSIPKPGTPLIDYNSKSLRDAARRQEHGKTAKGRAMYEWGKRQQSPAIPEPKSPAPLEVLGAKSGKPYPGFHEVSSGPPAPGAPTGSGVVGSEGQLKEALDRLIDRLGKTGKERQDVKAAGGIFHGADKELAAVSAAAANAAPDDAKQAEKYMEWALKAAAVLIG